MADPILTPVTRPAQMAQRHWLDPLARQLLKLIEAPRPAVAKAPTPAPWRLDVNRANRADWLRLPGCEPAQADLLLRLQQGGVQLSGCDDLANLLNLSTPQLEAWRPHLLFRWYSEPPAALTGLLDLNRASAAELESLEPLTPARRQRLLRERTRGPFSHMADLQERLGLPAAVVEALIGRVCFGAASSGPELPLQRR